MKLLVTGAGGLVGSHFIQSHYHNQSNNITVLAPAKEELDITNQQSVRSFLQTNKPDTIVHFAAFTDVSLSEKERGNQNGITWKVNVSGTMNLVESADHQPYFIYISTDAVFSGLKENPGPYPENYPVEQKQNLLSWYGWTKRKAEKIVLNNLDNAAILRISNPVRAQNINKLDYIHKILFRLNSNKPHLYFTDQYLTLTYINEVTQCLNVLLKKKLPGIYHVSSSNVFTPFELANFLTEKVKMGKYTVKPGCIKEFLKNNPSRYPQYGGLKVEKTQTTLNLKFKNWEDVIEVLSKQWSV